MILEVKDIDTYTKNSCEIYTTFNNDTISFKKLLKVMLNLRNNYNTGIEEFNINKIYHYDIAYLKLNVFFFYNVKEEIEKEFKEEFKEELKRIEEEEVTKKEEEEIFNNFFFNLKEEEKEIINKFNKNNYFRRNEINTKKVEILNNYLEEIIKKEEEVNFKFPHLISSLIKNYKIGNLNKVLLNKEIANKKKLTSKTDIRKLRRLLLKLYEILEEDKKEALDIYILKDYKYLDTTKEDFYRNFENLEVFYKELGLKPFTSSYENEINKPTNIKRNKELISLVYSLH